MKTIEYALLGKIKGGLTFGGALLAVPVWLVPLKKHNKNQNSSFPIISIFMANLCWLFRRIELSAFELSEAQLAVDAPKRVTHQWMKDSTGQIYGFSIRSLGRFLDF